MIADLLAVISHPVTLQSISCAGGEATSGTSALTLRSVRLCIEPSIPAVTVKSTCGNLCQTSRYDAHHLGLGSQSGERGCWPSGLVNRKTVTPQCCAWRARRLFWCVISLRAIIKGDMLWGCPSTTRENIHCKAAANRMEQ